MFKEIGVFDPKYATEADVMQAEDLDLPPGITFRVFKTEKKALAWAHAVLICSPDRFHLAQMKLAVEAGKHVFCEKPLATSVDELDTLRAVFEMARAKGVTITSCHPRRFDPPYMKLRETLVVLRAWLGNLLDVRLDFSYHIPSKTGLHGGSMLQDHANHEIDYLCWLLEKPVSFIAHKLWDEEDRYAMAGVRADRVTFTFGGTRRLRESVYPESIVLRFERGEVLVDTKDARNSYVLVHGTRERVPLDFPVTDYTVRFSNMNAHWLDLIAGRATNYLTEDQMRLNTEMSVAFHDDAVFVHTV